MFARLFGSCFKEPEPKRPKIDRSMIGDPTNFQHTGHIGSGDMGALGSQLPSVEQQMKSKGGHIDTDDALPESASPSAHALPITQAQETIGSQSNEDAVETAAAGDERAGGGQPPQADPANTEDTADHQKSEEANNNTGEDEIVSAHNEADEATQESS